MDLTAFFEAFDIVPNDTRLYERALSHCSYLHQHRIEKKMAQQERLEFFGDAVLKFVVSYFLMHTFPTMEEGVLTKIRSRIISDQTLAQLGFTMGLDHYVQVSDSERTMGGHQRPALLADTFEAIIGALFLDRGADYTQDWVSAIIQTHLADYLNLDHIVDYKTYLQETVQKLGAVLPQYQCTQVQGPEHQKIFTYTVQVSVSGHAIRAVGEGCSKKVAQQQAAEHCVKQMRAAGIV